MKSNKLPPFTLSLILGSVLLAMLFIPGAQRALDILMRPVRVITYPRASDDQSHSNPEDTSTTDKLQVISYGANPVERELIVDVEGNETAVGDAVISRQILIGVVSEVGDRRARVALINDPSFRVIARTSSDARGLVTSNYNQIMLIDVARGDSLVVGDTVFTLNNQYPNIGKVLIGEVDEVVDEDGLLRQALLRQPVELDDISRVSIP